MQKSGNFARPITEFSPKKVNAFSSNFEVYSEDYEGFSTQFESSFTC